MNTKLIAALILGSFVLAGCGSGGSNDTAQTMDGTTPPTETDTSDQVSDLQDQLDAAEERARQAEAARQQAEMEAEEARQAASRAEARPAFTGLGAAAVGTVTSVTPKYRAKATVVTNPSVTFASSSLSSSGSWSVTTLSNAGSANQDDLVVYTDMGAPTSVLITEHATYGSTGYFTEVPNTNNIQRSLTNDNANPIASSRFPGGGRSTTYDHTIDSDHTVDADNDGTFTNDYDTTRFSGTFGGASGTFECTGTCTVQHQGGNVYNLSSGTWTFTTSKTARVSVNDDSYMYFGWWKREQIVGGSLSFAAFANGAHEVANIPDTLTGTATYTGPAVGQYAIYQPAGGESSAGSFTASATLTANFGAADAEGTLSGRVTNFSNDADWSLTLMSQTIDGGGVARPGDPVANPSVSWTIGTHTETGGAWDAQFFSDVNGSTAIPEGVAGTFDGQFGQVGRLVGAFGAHCPTSTCPRN